MLLRLILIVLIVYVLLGMFSRRVAPPPQRPEKAKKDEGQMKLDYVPPPQPKKYQPQAPRATEADYTDYEEL